MQIVLKLNIINYILDEFSENDMIFNVMRDGDNQKDDFNLNQISDHETDFI